MPGPDTAGDAAPDAAESLPSLSSPLSVDITPAPTAPAGVTTGFAATAFDPDSGDGAGGGFDPDAQGGAAGAAGGVAGPLAAYSVSLTTPAYLTASSDALLIASVAGPAPFAVRQATFALTDGLGAPAGGFTGSVRLDTLAAATGHDLGCLLDATALSGYYALTVSADCDDGSTLLQTVALEVILFVG